VAFGYFETLFALRDLVRIQNEVERFKNLNVLLEQVGIAEHIYEIFVDTTEDILNRIHAAIRNGVQDETFLVEAFNESYSADAVITHFRVSISAGAIF
jgi:ubiquitin thioesterase protein OTUB1